MTSTELIKKLFLAVAKEDIEEFYNLAEEYINMEKRKKHTIVAKELKEALYHKPIKGKKVGHNIYKNNIPIPRDTENGFPLLDIMEYSVEWDDIVLDDENKYTLSQIIKEYNDSEILATYNLKPKNKILLCGKPGTGKTYTAKLISSILQIPLVYIRFDSILSSFLGETATNLRKIFEFISNGTWIVLFDEFDIIAKNRDDHYEHGEVKRVVNNLLQMIDSYEGDSIIIAATNHQHILDPAIWRRFDEVLYYDTPDELRRMELMKLFLQPIKKKNLNLDKFIKETEGFSPSDLKLMCVDAINQVIINDKQYLTDEDLKYSLDRFIKRMKIKAIEGELDN